MTTESRNNENRRNRMLPGKCSMNMRKTIKEILGKFFCAVRADVIQRGYQTIISHYKRLKLGGHQAYDRSK
jgi:hypothetical protein